MLISLLRLLCEPKIPQIFLRNIFMYNMYTEVVRNLLPLYYRILKWTFDKYTFVTKRSHAN